jgi:hypothetical protein
MLTQPGGTSYHRCHSSGQDHAALRREQQDDDMQFHVKWRLESILSWRILLTDGMVDCYMKTRPKEGHFNTPQRMG